jgi:hypothetical protein
MQDIRTWLQSAVKNYDSGVKLYLKYGNNPGLKALFTDEDESDFKRAKLIRVLADLAGAHQSVNPEKSSAVAPQSIQGLNQRNIVLQKDIHQAPVDSDRFCALRLEMLQNKIAIVKAEQDLEGLQAVKRKRSWSVEPITDDVEKALHGQWKPLYAELMSLQHRVYDLAVQGEKGDSNKKLEACQAAHRIVDLDQLIDDIYLQRDQYLATGKLFKKLVAKEVIGDPVRWATELANLKRYAREYRLKLSKHPNDRKAAKWAEKLADIDVDIDKYKKLLKLDDETT